MADSGCGLREICVDGQRYRWLTRRHFVRSPDSGRLSATFRLFVMPLGVPGARLRVLLDSRALRAPAGRSVELTAIAPAVVEAAVRHARKSGWSAAPNSAEFAILDGSERFGAELLRSLDQREIADDLG